jgi:small subunit ribosomal protein S20
MPNIASAKKRMRQNEVRRGRNRVVRSRLRSVLRLLDEAIEAGDLELVRARWTATQVLLDRTAQRGIIHRNLAARKKSRLARRIRAIGT